ncbi:1148_t:CDS:10, partial [Acaulospora colombiana]
MANRHLYQSLEDGLPEENDGSVKKILKIFLFKLRGLRWILAGVIFMILTTLLGFIMYKESSDVIVDPGLIVAYNGAVASEQIICSQFGVDVLREEGNAVDAAIASMICVGTINAFSAGIGGLPNGTSEVIDFRETAPGAATKDMLAGNNKNNGLTIGIPGEVAGMRLAHEKYGKLPWKRLLEPSINISRNGFPVPPELGVRLELYRDVIMNNPQLAATYAPNGELLKEGQILYRTNYSITLEKIANDYTDFYNGSIARSLIKTIKASGGIMTLEDLANYRPVLREPVVGYYHGRKDKTHKADYYNPVYAEINDHGTTHLSTIGKDDMAVAFTSTINRIWGSNVMDPDTGIILNDQLDDFSTPGVPDFYGMLPSPHNFIVPGKKPLSSTVPTIIEKDGKLELTLGGSGGTKILSAVLEVILNIFDFDMNVLQAIQKSRVHQQLKPEIAFMESGFSYELLNDLLDIGHVIQIANVKDRRFACMVQAARKFENGTIH